MNRLPSFAWMTIAAVIAAALFWLTRGHWGHLFGLLPYLLFLACPLMHLFMHHGHRGHGHDGDTVQPASK